MPQISNKKLDSKTQLKLNKLFLELISSANNHSSSATIIRGIFTETERVMFTKRIAAFIMINNQDDYETISSKLCISHNTISRLKRMYSNSPIGFQKIIHSISQSDKFKDLIHELIFDTGSIVPPKGRNWSKWRLDNEKRKKQHKKSL